MTYAHFYFDTISQIDSKIFFEMEEENIIISATIFCGTIVLSGLGYVLVDKICKKLDQNSVTIQTHDDEKALQFFELLDP